MNRGEWIDSCKNHVSGIYKYYNKCEKIRKTLEYNQDPSATHKHHLFNMPEQIAYNNEHYELWGFEIDEDGNEHFEYGKYIVFLTPEEHNSIHNQLVSEETRKKLSESRRRLWEDDNFRSKMLIALKGKSGLTGKDHPMYGKHHSEESKQKIRDHLPDLSGENNPFYGKHHSEESRRKISENHVDVSGENNPMYGKHLSEDHKRKLSESGKGKHSGERNWMFGKRGADCPHYGRHLSDETKLKISKANKGKNSKLKGVKRSAEACNNIIASRQQMSNKYKVYKESGGELSWNDFQKCVKHDEILILLDNENEL